MLGGMATACPSPLERLEGQRVVPVRRPLEVVPCDAKRERAALVASCFNYRTGSWTPSRKGSVALSAHERCSGHLTMATLFPSNLSASHPLLCFPNTPPFPCRPSPPPPLALDQTVWQQMLLTAKEREVLRVSGEATWEPVMTNLSIQKQNKIRSNIGHYKVTNVVVHSYGFTFSSSLLRNNYATR